jgi:hypothetical protein
MFASTKIAIATTLVLGTASVALANDIETNPSTAQSVREWNEYQGHRHMGNAGTDYGYYGLSTQHDDFQSGKKNRNR